MKITQSLIFWMVHGGNCGGLEKMEWMVFDPNNKDMLYVCGGAKTHRVVNFAEETLGTIKFTGEASGDCNIFEFYK